MSDNWEILNRMNNIYVEGTPLCSSDIDAIEWAVARIARLEGAIYEYMQTTDQRSTRERMVGNFVGMYTNRRSNHA